MSKPAPVPGILEEGSSDRAVLLAAGRGHPGISLRDGFLIPATYGPPVNLSAESTTVSDGATPFDPRRARPLALATADFDEDGAADLVAGYADPRGGIFVLHRGLGLRAPSDRPELDSPSFAAILAGRDTTWADLSGAPSPLGASVFEAPAVPELLEAGDFDLDGHVDLVFAAHGDESFYLLPGDGLGGFRSAEQIALPGPLTALTAGDVNRADGLADLIVGVVADGVPRALIFERLDGALSGDPEIIDLPQPATSFAVGQLDGHYAIDLAIAAGDRVLVVHGRDHWLSSPDGARAAPLPPVDEHPLPFTAVSVAIGRFELSDLPSGLALLAEDGAVHVMRVRQASRGSASDGKKEAVLEEAWRSDPIATPRAAAGVSSSSRQMPLDGGPGAGGAEIAVEAEGARGAGASIAMGAAAEGSNGAKAAAVLSADRMAAPGLATAGLASGQIGNGSTPGDAPPLPAARLVPLRLSGSAEDIAVVDPTQHRLHILSPPSTRRDADRPVFEERGSDARAIGQRAGSAQAASHRVSDVLASDVLAPDVQNPDARGANDSRPFHVALDLEGRAAGLLPMLLGDDDGLTDLVVLMEGAAAPAVSLTTPLVTFTVNNAGDASDAAPGDGACLAVGGGCTLRAAIEEANALAGSDTISFSLGAGTPTIAPASPLPPISSTVNITGNTGGASRIELNGAGAGAGANGLTFVSGSNGSGARSLVVNRFNGTGIRVESASVVVDACMLGTDPGGNPTVAGNAGGGLLITGAGATSINTSPTGINYICHNDGFGISVDSGASGNTLTQSNSVGACPNGVSNPNNGDGVLVTTGANNNTLSAFTVANAGHGVEMTGGATTAGNRVLASISGNALDGVRINGGAQSNSVGIISCCTAGGFIFGNGPGNPAIDGVEISGAGTNLNKVYSYVIGLTSAGTVQANGGAGVRVTSGAQSTTIGNTTNFPGSSGGNIISGNGTFGVRIEGAGTTGTIVQGNMIGTDGNGTATRANTGDGVSISGTGGNVVGGSATNTRNLISANTGDGVEIAENGATGNTVQSNYIGVEKTGTLSLPNSGSGVRIAGTVAAASNVIGAATFVVGDAPGNLISGNAGAGVLITGAGATGNTVSGNLIGTTVQGNAPLGNRANGVQITNAANNTIGGTTSLDLNVISGNATSVFTDGVEISGPGATGNRVQGNFIGTDRTGTAVILNGGNGVFVRAGADANVIGGPTAIPGRAPGNLISGNYFDFSSDGVEITGVGTTGNLVQGNLIGTDFAGTGSLANGNNGVLLSDGASGNTVGGTAANLRNVISGSDLTSASDGVEIDQASGNTVTGNYIGTSIAGTAALPNGGNGVLISDGNGLAPATGNVIGGTTAAARNVIAANMVNGVRLAGDFCSGNTVSGNFIGVDSGGSPLGNVFNGVLVTLGANGNTIGGTTGLTVGACTGSCNRITSNGDAGVRVSGAASDGNAIRGNSMASNAGLGIDLEPPSGVTPNDALDADTGANDLQNFPVITGADYDGTSTTVTGTIASAPSTTYTIDVFGNASPDPTNHGEGADYLGTTTVLTDGSGDGTWSLVVPGSHDFPTATATNPGLSTSEFSQAFANPGEARGLLATKGSGTSVAITYVPSCDALDHAVYLGTTPIAGAISWGTCFCAIGTSGGGSFDPGTPPAGRSFYFAVVGQNASKEGSYGRSSAGAERPEAVAMMGTCDLPQSLAFTCP